MSAQTDTSSSCFQGGRAWGLAVLLYLPMAAVAAVHLLLPPDGGWPTGFLQYDQQSYMAMAREPFDALAEGRGFSPAYGLPTSDDPATPRLYLYPHLLVLGAVQRLTEMDPGRLYLLFGVLAGVVFLRLAIALYARVVTARDGAALLGLVLFVWGGGLFVLAGAGASAADGRLDYNSLFQFDPGGGFWFLNLGRNLFYAVETYYHALVFALLLCLLDRRWWLAMLLLALLAASHPFTGLQFLLIVLAWALVLRIALGTKVAPPLSFTAAAAALSALFLAYHFLLLPESEEHAWLMQHWSLSWTLSLPSLLLAYAPVALLALWAAVRGTNATLPSSDRLLLAGTAFVSLVLAQHDLLIAPRQPLHFTRGYIWFPLFLLGAPLLVALLRRLLHGWRTLAALAIAGFFLLDNAAWLAVQEVQNAGGFGAARYLSADERALLHRLDDPALAGTLLVSDDDRLGYDALVYTALRSWYSHEHLTPWSTERRADVTRWAASGEEPEAWKDRRVVFATRGLPSVEGEPWVTADSEVERYGDWLLVIRPAQTPQQ